MTLLTEPITHEPVFGPAPLARHNTPVTCPNCDGQKRVNALIHGLCSIVTCSTCKGAGTIERQHLDRIEIGQVARRRRVANCMSGRQEAARIGVTPVQLSHFEQGKELSPDIRLRILNAQPDNDDESEVPDAN